MNQIANSLANKWGTEGFNNHEKEALKVGYIDNFFPDYLPLKQKLLEGRDGITDGIKKKHYNALRIYSYSIFENVWYGYLASYADHQETRFKIENHDVNFENAFRNHLPSFSSAILNFGTCRDLFFILLKLLIAEDLVNDAAGIKRLLNTRYTKIENFISDLSQLCSDQDYLNEGKIFFDRNMFRNFFAHKIRLLWWKNKKCSAIDYYVTKQIYDDIQNRRHTEYHSQVEKFFKDHKSYENLIETSPCSQLVSAAEMLKEAHDSIASFLNRSFGFLRL